MACTLCHGAGYVLDGKRDIPTLELIECPIPDCAASGRRIEVLSFKGTQGLLRFGHVSRHPREHWVMSVSAPL